MLVLSPCSLAKSTITSLSHEVSTAWRYGPAVFASPRCFQLPATALLCYRAAGNVQEPDWRAVLRGLAVSKLDSCRWAAIVADFSVKWSAMRTLLHSLKLCCRCPTFTVVRWENICILWRLYVFLRMYLAQTIGYESSFCLLMFWCRLSMIKNMYIQYSKILQLATICIPCRESIVRNHIGLPSAVVRIPAHWPPSWLQ